MRKEPESPVVAWCTLRRSQTAPQLTNQRTETQEGEAVSLGNKNDNDRNTRMRKCGPKKALGPQMIPHRGRLMKRQKGWKRSRMKWAREAGCVALGTPAIWGRLILLWGRSVHCRRFGSAPASARLCYA